MPAAVLFREAPPMRRTNPDHEAAHASIREVRIAPDRAVRHRLDASSELFELVGRLTRERV
jgi:hypothetical protein